MQLTVIIPNYNGVITLERCLTSIYSQNIKPMEIIMVDDASTDNSVKTVKSKYPEVRVIRNQRNYGAAQARNRGIANSKGEILLFIDSDVYFNSACLEQMLQYIEKFDIVYPTVLFESGEMFSPAFEQEKLYIRRSPLFLIKKNSLGKLDDYFDENYFIYYEDVDFFMRCYLAGLKSKYVNTATAFHSIMSHSRNLERRFYLEAKNRIYCIIKFSSSSKSARKFLLIPNIRHVWNMVYIAYSNKNIYSSYPDHAGEDKLSNSRVKLIYILIKAIMWNILNLGRSLGKRRIISEKFGG